MTDLLAIGECPCERCGQPVALPLTATTRDTGADGLVVTVAPDHEAADWALQLHDDLHHTWGPL